MSLFAKECLSRHPSPFQTTRVLHQLFSIPRSSRQLSSSPHLHNLKKPHPKKLNSLKPRPSTPLSKSKPTVNTPPKSIPSANAPKYTSYASQLASKTHSTLLYSAPSNTLFKIFSYTGAFFCTAYSGYNIYVHYLYPPPDLAKWVVYSFGGIAVFMSAFGTWLFLGPAKMIRTITAVPKRLNVSNVNSLTKIVGGPPTELQIEIELSKMFPVPFFPARKILVSPSEVELSAPLTPPVPLNLTPAERLALHEAEKQESKARQDYEDTHIMTRPFRHFGRGMKKVYEAAARTWLREGFVNCRIQGGSHKLDVSGGWALDGGRALDRLVVVRPRTPGSWMN